MAEIEKILEITNDRKSVKEHLWAFGGQVRLRRDAATSRRKRRIENR